jgi:sulfoacetaldehyde acetyltransferase
MTPSEAFVETLVAQGVTDVFGIVGSATWTRSTSFRGGHPLHLGGARAGRRAHGRRLRAVSGRHGVCIAQNGPGITNFVTSTPPRSGRIRRWSCHAETGSMTLGLGGFQETEQLPIFSKITKYQAHVNNRARMAELTGRAFDRAMLEMGPTQLNIRAISSTATSNARFRARSPSSAAPAARRASIRRRRLLAQAKFPVILAAAASSWAARRAMRSRSPSCCRRRCASVTCTTTRFRRVIRCGAVRSATRGSKAAMKLIAKADVVLALGTRLGPFGTLPQHGLALLAEGRADHPDRRRPEDGWAS